MLSVFIGSSIALVFSNYLYQFCCVVPDWAAATERSFFQLVALIAVAAALAIRSINT